MKCAYYVFSIVTTDLDMPRKAVREEKEKKEFNRGCADECLSRLLCTIGRYLIAANAHMVGARTWASYWSCGAPRAGVQKAHLLSQGAVPLLSFPFQRNNGEPRQ